MRVMSVAARILLGDLRLHRGAIVFVKRVALDEGGGNLLATEDLVERVPHGGRACPDEPVMTIMGNFLDMALPPLRR